MKKFLKMFGVSVLLIIAFTISVFADELNQISDYNGIGGSEFSGYAQNLFNSMYSTDEETFNSQLELYAEEPELLQGFEAMKTIRESGEEFVDFGAYNLYENEDGEVRFYQALNFENSNYVMIIGFDSSLTCNYYDINTISYKDGNETGAVLDISECEIGELGSSTTGFFNFDKEVLLGALKNAIIGICIVAFILIFISLIISLFKFIPSDEKKAYEKQLAAKKQNAQQVKPVSEAPAAQVNTDNTQLVAVITAAISAYEKVPADSFVVRTIKKRKWK